MRHRYYHLKAIINSNGVSAYWWTGERNFGDLITPYLLSSYGYTPLLATKESACLVATGSLIQILPYEFSGTILGTGLIAHRNHPLPFARFLAVRGPKTRDCLGLDAELPLGDPALLVGRFVKSKSTIHEVGLIPHYVDKKDPGVARLKRFFGEDAIIIDVMKDPRDVFSKISRCKFVFSSSLHGIIVAQSLGIRAAWVKFSNKVTGDGFKFLDYSESVGYGIRAYQHEELANPVSIMKSATQPSSELKSIRISKLDAIFKASLRELVSTNLP